MRFIKKTVIVGSKAVSLVLLLSVWCLQPQNVLKSLIK